MNAQPDVKTFSVDSLSPKLREQLMEVLEGYLAQQEQGLPPDPEQLVAQHPDLAEPLRVYLGSLDFLHRAAFGFKPSHSVASAPADFAEKRLGDYTILREIGRGGMGIVYEAKQISLDRRVALKLLPFAAVLDQRQIARFGNEARAAAQLHHPNIVPVFGIGCERGVHYYAMQYVEGQTIGELIGQLRSLAGSDSQPPSTEAASQLALDLGHGRLVPSSTHASADPSPSRTGGPDRQSASPPADTSTGRLAHVSTDGSTRSREFFHSVAHLGIQAAKALEHAHQMGVVHRDVKPSNLMVDVRGHLWVTDFGLAMTQTDPNLTMTGDLLGTLRYMSPEQVEGQRRVLDHRTDVYSLGATLYELLTLGPAFAGSHRQRLIRRIAEDDPRPPRHLNKAVPRDLETIVLKAMAKEPERRYSTADDLADDLGRFLEGKPTLAKRPTLADRAGKWARRHRTAVWSAAALSLIALVGLVTSILLVAGAHSRTKDALAEAEAGFRSANLNYRQARRVVDRSARYAERLANLPGAEQLRQELLTDALDYYQGFIEQSANDPTLEVDLGLTYFKIGQITKQIGDRQTALDAYEEARQVLKRLAASEPGEKEHRRSLALCHNDIGLLLSQTGDTGAAEKAYRQAIEIQTQLVEQSPRSPEFRRDLATSYSNLGLLQSETSEPAQAEESYRAALNAQKELVRECPQEPKYLSNLAISYNNLGSLYSKDQPEEAEQCFRDALALQGKLVKAYPGNTEYQSNLALTYNNLGAFQSHGERLDEAKASYLEAIAIQERLRRRAPSVLSYRRDLAISHNNLGRLHSRWEQPELAFEAFDRARLLLEALVEDHPRGLSYRSILAGILNNQGMVLEQLDRPDDAADLYQQAIGHQRFVLERAPSVDRFREFLGKHYSNLGRALRAANRPAEAARAALAHRELWSGNPKQLCRVAGELALAASQIQEAVGGLSEEQTPAGRPWADQAVATLREAVEAGLAPLEEIEENPHFEGLRSHPEFQRLLGQSADQQGEPDLEGPPARESTP